MNDQRLCLCGCGQSVVQVRNGGKPKKFFSKEHKVAFWQSTRAKASQAIARKSSRAYHPSRHAEQVSRFVFMTMVPVEERADLLRQAAQNLGITDEKPLLTSLRACGV